MEKALHVVGVAGYKRSGKDTLADALVQVGFAKVRVAEPIRDLLLGLDPEWRPGHPPRNRPGMLSELVASGGWDKAKETMPSLRRLMIQAGRELKRLKGEHYLTTAMTDSAENYLLRGCSIVVPDVRTAEEAEALRKLPETVNGVPVVVTIVRVDRPSAEPCGLFGEAEAIGGIEPDVVLGNTGSLEEYERECRDMFWGFAAFMPL